METDCINKFAPVHLQDKERLEPASSWRLYSAVPPSGNFALTDFLPVLLRLITVEPLHVKSKLVAV